MERASSYFGALLTRWDEHTDEPLFIDGDADETAEAEALVAGVLAAERRAEKKRRQRARQKEKKADEAAERAAAAKAAAAERAAADRRRAIADATNRCGECGAGLPGKLSDHFEMNGRHFCSTDFDALSTDTPGFISREQLLEAARVRNLSFTLREKSQKKFDFGFVAEEKDGAKQ